MNNKTVENNLLNNFEEENNNMIDDMQDGIHLGKNNDTPIVMTKDTEFIIPQYINYRWYAPRIHKSKLIEIQLYGMMCVHEKSNGNSK